MITVDASVWIGFLDRNDPFHSASDSLLQRLQASSTPYYSPEFAALEVACALARRQRDAQAGRMAAGLLRRNSRLWLVETVRLTATPLVTWDRELIERAGALTPEQWLARQPSLE